MSQFAVVLPAAGQSRRFGGLEKKPFVSLGGRPVWQRTAELFWNRPDVSKVYLVLSPDDRADFQAASGHLIAFANVELVTGGAERFESVANALAAIPETVEYVAVHDAVRPLTTAAQIDATFAAAKATGAAILALPVADTLKRVDGAAISETVSRSGLWQAQTPQAFRRDWLAAAYANRALYGPSITDDSQLVEASGRRVTVVTGSLTNFKITAKDDVALAETVLASRYGEPPAGVGREGRRHPESHDD